jgi:MFS superfamily sulfate permease-like transporter
MIVVLLSLEFLTSTFFYIPQAALAAIIWAAVWNLISVTDAWNAYKRNKSDFFVLITTWVVTMVVSTELALAVGIGLSFGLLIKDTSYGESSAPVLLRKAEENNGIDVLLLKQALSFITCTRAKDAIVALSLTEPEKSTADSSIRDRIVLQVASFLDYLLVYQRHPYVKEVPKAIIVDFSSVSAIDWTSLTFIKEALVEVRRAGALVVIINASPAVEKELILVGIENDGSEQTVFLDEYLIYSGNIPIMKRKDKEYSELKPISQSDILIDVDNKRQEI